MSQSASPAGRVQGKVALVTGAAGGIGAAIATSLAREGATVVLADLQAASCVQQAAALGGEARTLDVTDEAAWRDTLALVVATHGRLDILVNNAGVLPGLTPLEETPLEDWQRVTKINLDGVFLGLKHGIAAMKASGGAIVNMASIFGLAGAPIIGAYGATKHAVVGLTKSAALECAHLGYAIRVNAVCPGYVDTPMTRSLSGSMGIDAELSQLAARAPMGRLAEPSEIAAAVLYLASDEASFVTGTELVIDGGFLAG
jgi:NAD(P)-dependent dehydrogenase (short-subunit alcohol dehydrogenase family)